MSLFENIATWLSRFDPRTPLEAESGGARSYDAGKTDRYVRDFPTDPRSEDQDTLQGLVELRSRARILCQNNPWAKRYIQLCRTNIPGPRGFKLQMDVREWRQVNGKPEFVEDEIANLKIEDAFAEWARPENCTVAGNLSFRQVQHLVVTHRKRDGEYLIRKIYDHSKFGFKLQLLDPYMLDESYSAKLGENVVRMGIEYDKWRKPVAYHLRKVEPALSVYGIERYSRDRERVPASEIYHGFDQTTAFQSRGVSEFSPVMLRLRHIDKSELASVINFRLSASKSGFLKNQQGAEFQTKDPLKQGEDSQGNSVNKIAPGVIDDIGNKDFVPINYDFPTAQYDPFIKSQLRAVASGLGSAYNLLGNDLVGVNYSSIRAGTLDEREFWKMEQENFTDSFLLPLFSDWLRMALLTGAVQLPAAKYDKYNRPVWIGRRWDWVDPLKDIVASLASVEGLVNTRTQLIADRGDDIKDVFRDLASERKLAEKYGLRGSEAAGEPPQQDPEDPDKEDKEPQDEDEELKRDLDLLSQVRRILSFTKKRNGHNDKATA